MTFQKGLRCILCAMAITTISFLTITAYSGEILKLKTGDVKLDSKLSRGVDLISGSREFVVQFSGPITLADKNEIQKHGFKILNYIPDDALVIYGSGEALSQVRALSSVRAVEVFNSIWKTSPDFNTASVFTRSQKVLTHIRLSNASYSEGLQTILGQNKNIKIHYANDRVIVADLPRNEVASIATFAGVEWMEPIAKIQTMEFDPGVAPQNLHFRGAATGYESGTKVMGFESAWARGFDGAGEVAAMADTGLDTGKIATLHKDLSNTKNGEFVLGFNIPIPLFSWKDTVGHGTHVAGSIVGTGAMSNGLIRGGAYQAEFFAQGVGIGEMLNPLALQSPKATLDPAIAKNVHVHSNSWGAASKGAYDAMAAAYDDYIWNHPDVLVVFAAGNEGVDENKDGLIDEGSIGSPGTAKNVMTVGASENYLGSGGIQKTIVEMKPKEDGTSRWPAEPIASDTFSNNPNGMAAFSSRGPTTDGRLKPDIVAPGTNIVSVRSSMIKPDAQNPTKEPLWGVYDSNYLFCGGTSMATPLASGAATVTRQFLIKSKGLATPSAAVIKATLMHTAYDMYPGQYGSGPTQELPTQRPNIHEGYGRIDMDKLTRMGQETIVLDEKVGVALGEAKTYSVRSPGDITATLVYTDAPGTASAQKALVNDIDLAVVAPDGRVFTKNDHVNNNEIIEIRGGLEGEYTVKVTGTNIPQGKNGKQPYALIISPY